MAAGEEAATGRDAGGGVVAVGIADSGVGKPNSPIALLFTIISMDFSKSAVVFSNGAL